MRARFWGSRGSLASPGPDTVRTGGNTSCVEVRPDDGSLVILDSGTGIRALGASLDGTAPKRIDILLSHLHLDHLEGLGFFAPLWDPGTELHIWGPPSPTRSLVRSDLAVPLAAAVPRAAGRGAGARSSSTTLRDEPWIARLGDDHRSADHPPRSDRGLPHRGRGTEPRLPHRPRAGALGRSLDGGSPSGSRGSRSPPGPTC